MSTAFDIVLTSQPEHQLFGDARRSEDAFRKSQAMVISKNLTDHYRCATSDSQCGYWEAMFKQVALRSLQQVGSTANGIYSLAKGKACTCFWMTPSALPFAVVVCNTARTKFRHHRCSLVTLTIEGLIHQARRPQIHENRGRGQAAGRE